MDTKKLTTHHITLTLILLYLTTLLIRSPYLQSRFRPTYSPRFGVTYHTEIRFDYQKSAFDRNEILLDLKSIRNLGVDIVRTDASWERVPINSVSAIAFDTWLIEQIHALGMKIILIIKTPEQIILYSTILDKVDYIQVSNEPNNLVFAQKAGSKNNTETTEKLSQYITLIKKYSPTSTIIINPVDLPKVRGIITSSWLDIYQDLNKKGVTFSVVGLDSYPGGPYQWGYPTNMSWPIQTIRQKNYSNNIGQIQVWIIETGAPTYKRSDTAQARYIKEAVLTALIEKVDGIIIYEAFDNKNASSEITTAIPNTTGIEGSFGLLHENRMPKPAYREYSQLIYDVRNKLPITIPFTIFLYETFTSVLRLIMPMGGPIALSELATTPCIFYSVIGLLFRYILGQLLPGNKRNRVAVFTALIIVAGMVIFQIATNTYALLWHLWLGYLLFFFLHIWCGIIQINIMSKNSTLSITPKYYLLLPSTVGMFVALILDLSILGWFLYILAETIIILAIKQYIVPKCKRNRAG